jgi:hypothetical protein
MKYLLGTLGVVLVTIFAVVLIVSRPKNDTVQPVTGDTSKALVNYATTEARTVFTTEGRLVGNEERRAIRITVDRNERVLEILTGYDGAVERAERFGNTTSAYEAFLAALDQAGYTKTRKLSAVKQEDGACPLGKHYTYELKQGQNEIARHWATTCGVKVGNFAGKRTTIDPLFEAQIPNYDKLVAGVKL